MTLTRLAFLGLVATIVIGSLAIWRAVPVVPQYAPVVVYEYPDTISPSSLMSNQLLIGNGGASGQCMAFDGRGKLVWSKSARRARSCVHKGTVRSRAS